MKIGHRFCVHCGCNTAQKTGEKWLCAQCGLETTPAQTEAYAAKMLRLAQRPPKPSQN